MSTLQMFLSSTLIIFIASLYDTIQGDLSCSCKDYSGCLGNNSCLPSPTECKQENVALGKTANMSTQYNGGDGSSGPACLAVNGNRSQTAVFTDPGKNCIHTDVSDYTPWWSVDLGSILTITSVTIYNRDSLPDRLTGVVLYVDQQVCNTITDGTQMVLNVTCKQPVRGQKVILRKDTRLLQFCELEVWVCSAGRYGQTCDELCNGNCKNNETCDNYNGTCWSGCKDGLYGDFCNHTCGHCKNISCHQTSGSCLYGCLEGWEGTLCNIPCSPGSYGPGCTQSCGQCTEGNTTCNITTGVCERGCHAGYVTSYCNQTCSRGYYGNNCRFKCGKCANNTTCNHVSGKCDQGCQDGLQPPYCSENCSLGYYGNNCNHTCGKCAGSETCDPNSGDCPSGCESGYQGPACDENYANTNLSSLTSQLHTSTRRLMMVSLLFLSPQQQHMATGCLVIVQRNNGTLSLSFH